MAAGSALVGRILNVFRRGEARDVFSADDGETFDDFAETEGDDEPEERSRLGPKIALIASGVIFLLLGGSGVAIYLMGRNATAPMVEAPLADLKVDDDIDLAALKQAPPPKAPGQNQVQNQAQNQAAKAPDVAATDRSTARRPWLTGPATDKSAAAPPAPAQKTPVPAPPTQTAAMTPPAPTTPPTAMTPPPPAIAPPPKTAPTPITPPPPAVAPPPPAQTAMTPPSTQTAATSPAPAKPAAPTPPEQQAAAAEPAMPSVLTETAPGAPDRFNGNGAANAGGRPRLVEPPLPPVDRKDLSAPPPRYAGIGDMRSKVTAYKASAPKPTDGKTGKIAIVVRDLGLSQAATEAAINKLPPAVTLSFSPYAQNLKKWMDMAKTNGHEVLVELPMESKQYPADDPGPLGLITSIDAKKNAEHMDAILKVAPSAMGVDDDTGSKFRESETAMNAVFAKLKEKNLFYVQTEPGVRIGESGVPNTIADVVVDERPFRAAIDARLDYAENLAKYQGSAVAVMDAKPVSFERLALWLDTLNSKGIMLAPISTVLVH